LTPASGDRLITLFLSWVTARAVLHRGWWVVVSLYMVVDARLTPTELLAIAAAQGLASVICEVPAGVLADTVSRKGAIVLAHALMGVAMIATGLFPSFVPLLLCQMLWGISWTFSSGADIAWITDELNQPTLIDRVLTREARWQLTGTILGLLGLGGLASLVGRQPAIVVAGTAMLVLGGAFAVVMPETGFVRTRVARWSAGVGIARAGLGLAVRSRLILALLIVTVLVNGAGDSFGRIYPVKLAEVGFPSGRTGTAWFTALSLAGSLVAVAALRVVERHLDTDRGARRAMVLACLAGVLGLAAFGLAPSIPLAVAALLLATGIAMPLVRTVTTVWVNRRTTSRVRATVHSFFAGAEYAGEIACALALAAASGILGASGISMVSAVLFAGSCVIVLVRTGAEPAADQPPRRP
jgi:MFS family permease